MREGERMDGKGFEAVAGSIYIRRARQLNVVFGLEKYSQSI